MAACHHCSAGVDDTARHSLSECSAWSNERRTVVTSIGSDLLLPAVVTAMVRNQSAWENIASFCETVISAKEGRSGREKNSLRPSPPATIGGIAAGGSRYRRKFENVESDLWVLKVILHVTATWEGALLFGRAPKQRTSNRCR